MLRQGRGQTLYKWLAALPSTLVSQDAWVLYWLGNCRLSIAPREARPYFEQALALFEKQADADPLYLVWSKILQSFVAETDDLKPIYKWLDYHSLLRENRAPASASIESASVFSYIAGLLLARFDHQDLVVYVERAERLFWNDPDRSNRIAWVATLISYHLWKGNVAEIDNLLKQVVTHRRDADPLVQLTLYMYKAMHAANIGAADDSLRAVTDGVALAASSGVNHLVTELVSYGIWGQLCVGNLAAARSLLQKITLSMRDGQIKAAFYSHYASLVALHEGDVVRAVSEGQRAAKLAKASGMFIGTVAHQIGLAYAYVQRGDLDAAQSALADAEPIAVAMASKFFLSYTAFCAANIHRLRGNHALALSALDKALALAQQGGFVTAGYCPRDTAAVLYSLALENGIYSDYVRATITKTQLLPPREFLSEQWPWRLRIYTLGRFLVMRDGEPLVLTARQHQKPLALLRVLVSYGGRFVSMTKLANCLWPDTEGDLAMHSLETTLYRLRKLAGDQCIATYNGQLTLNPDYCWLDSWAIEQLAEAPSIVGQCDTKIGRIVALYRGVFLDGDESPWVLVERERLRSKLLLAITQLGQANEAQGEHESAVACYQKGVEVDPLAEDLYRYLMACYAQLDQFAKALTVYLRCRDSLMSMLRIEPSAKTKALYAEIKRRAGCAAKEQSLIGDTSQALNYR
jgi:DNA-binding SARP family transcriptional activator